MAININWGDSSSTGTTLNGVTNRIFNHTYSGNTLYNIRLTGDDLSIMKELTISGSNLTTLPDFSDNRYDVQLLNFNNNKLTELPVFNVKVKSLYMNDNLVAKSTFPNLSSTKLETLQLNNNSFSGYTSGSLPNTIKNLSLSGVGFSNSNIDTVFYDLKVSPVDKSLMNIVMEDISVFSGYTNKFDLINSGATVSTKSRIILPFTKAAANRIYFYKLASTPALPIHIDWGDGTQNDYTLNAGATVIGGLTYNSIQIVHTFPLSATIYNVAIDTVFTTIEQIIIQNATSATVFPDLKEMYNLKYFNCPFVLGYNGTVDLTYNKKIVSWIALGANISNITWGDITKLKHFEHYTSTTRLSSVRFDLMTNLDYVYCPNGITGTLYTPVSKNITTFNTQGCNTFTNKTIPDFTSFTGLTTLNMQSCALTSSGVTNFNTLSALTFLNINSNSLTGNLPQLKNSLNLETYNANSNSFSNYIPDLNHLTKLKNLYLNSNLLSGLTADIVITGLTNLVQLYLGDNNFNVSASTTMDFTFNTALTHLHLRTSNLNGLHSSISGLTKLYYLNFEYNNITSLPSLYSSRNTLNQFYFRNNSITTLPPSFTGLTNLSFIDFQNNDLTNVDNLPISTATTTLYLNLNSITSLPSNLSGMTKLQNFYLYDNLLSGETTFFSGMTDLVQLQFYNNPTLSGYTLMNMTPYNKITLVGIYNCKLIGNLTLPANNTNFITFNGYDNYFSGNIPAPLAVMTNYRIYNNFFTGYTSRNSTFNCPFTNFSNNYLSSTEVNKVLADYRNYTTFTSGTLNLTGTNMGAPTGQGITDKNVLIARGVTVTTS